MVIILLSAVATFFLSLAWGLVARSLGIMDIPNVRSSHSYPLPRGGGIAILAVFSVFYFGIQGFGSVLSSYMIIPALVIGLMGLMDDMRGIRPTVKLCLELFCASMVFLGFQYTYLPIGSYNWDTGKWVAAIFALLWISGFTNFFNFMDGIDGIAAGQSTVAAAFLAIHFTREGDPQLTSIAMLLVGCSLGFLAVNAPLAKMFMGDVGSLFLGFMLSALVLVGSIRLDIPFWLLALPLYNFIFDPVYTLFRRVLSREKWYEAHRAHLYQRLFTGGWSHRKVTLVEMSMAIMLGALSLLPNSNYSMFQVSAAITVGFLSQVFFLFYVINRTESP